MRSVWQTLKRSEGIREDPEESVGLLGGPDRDTVFGSSIAGVLGASGFARSCDRRASHLEGLVPVGPMRAGFPERVRRRFAVRA